MVEDDLGDTCHKLLSTEELRDERYAGLNRAQRRKAIASERRAFKRRQK